jgi:hypothetical protein
MAGLKNSRSAVEPFGHDVAITPCLGRALTYAHVFLLKPQEQHVMINPARALAALTGAAALTIAGMSPASAAYWTHNDAVGDVQTQSETYDEETGDVQDSDLTPAPDNTDTDVTGVSVNHRTHRVVLKTSLRDITVASGVAIYDIRTGTRRYAVMQRLGKDEMFPAFDFSRANGDRVRCAGVERSVDRAAESATLNIPRRCLGRPGWVRVGVGAAKIDAPQFDETDSTFALFADDALRDASVLDELALSPRVRRR